MFIKRATLAIFLVLLVVCLPQIGKALDDFYIGRAHEKHALIINSWNDFPQENLKNIDALPAQALHAYESLKAVGYSDGEITLMVYHTGDSFVDFNGDGIDDLSKAEIDYEDAAVSKANLREALTEMAANSGENAEIVIYIISHGAYYMETVVFTFEDGSIVSYGELMDWLRPIKTKNVIILLDFCYSEGFTNNSFELCGAYVWASSPFTVDLFYSNWTNMNSADKAIFGIAGSVFFHPFWNLITEGKGVKESYYYGRSQLLRWKEVDHTIYRQNFKDLALMQRPAYHIQRDTSINLFAMLAGLSTVANSMLVVLALVSTAIVVPLARWWLEFSALSRQHGDDASITNRKQVTLEDYLN
jgi:hypothetical protein